MRVVFVCTGNTCRSPLAEHLLRRAIAERGIDGIEVTSCGTFARPGDPATDGAVRAGAARGVDLSGHRARRIDPGELRPDDLVLAMESIHARQVAALGADRPPVRLLGPFAPGGPPEVSDPIGGPDEAYVKCADRLRACLEGLLGWLAEERTRRT